MTCPGRFRKRPVEVEAMQWDGTAAGATPVIEWVLGAGGTACYRCEEAAACAESGGDVPHRIDIRTLEGAMAASAGDWVIRGVAGEFYPCRDDIFAKTYEPVGGGDV